MKVLVANVIVVVLCLFFLDTMLSKAHASSLTDQVITYGTCQATFAQSEGNFETELNNLDKSIQALAWSYGFDNDGSSLPNQDVAVKNARATLDEWIADVKSKVIAGWSNLDATAISNGLLGCRLTFADLSKT